MGVKCLTEGANSKLELVHSMPNNERLEMPYYFENHRQSFTYSTEFGSARENLDNIALNSFYNMSSAGHDSGVILDYEREDSVAIYSRQDSYDFPPLPTIL